uniref:Uncharacterized protein n=1 Tax=Arundo donax TaxID=35708 RepID=A0A0A9ACH6_ARUDO
MDFFRFHIHGMSSNLIEPAFLLMFWSPGFMTFPAGSRFLSLDSNIG